MNTPTTARAKLHARACEDAVTATLEFAEGKARHLGYRPSDIAAAIYGRTTERQARSLLIDALTLSHGISALSTTAILNSLRVIDRCHADELEAMEEFWSLIEDTAREQARECRESAGDAA